MTKTEIRETLRAARHWEQLPSPHDHKAVLFHNTAKSMRLHVETGVLHCNCHCVPADRCPTHPRNRGRL